MNYEGHKKALGIIHIVSGSLTIVLFLFLRSIFHVITPFLEGEILENEGSQGLIILSLIVDSISVIFIFFLITVQLPSVVGGIAILNGKKWGIYPLMVAGCISLFSFPLGTAIGIYTIWVYVNQNPSKDV